MGNDLKTYWLVSEKSWHESLFNTLISTVNANWHWCKTKKDFSIEQLEKYQPDKIFIPHWSYIIPENIYSKYTCIVFHMTDLPFGRGGSPLQNLIVLGKETTKISALKVSKGVDTGAIYLKKDLTLEGTAFEIFKRSSSVIEQMIIDIINLNPTPIEQQGEVVEFKRRTREDGNIKNLENINQIYDYIRMLDCEGYPNAFIELPNYTIEFTQAKIINENELTSHVRIFKKQTNTTSSSTS